MQQLVATNEDDDDDWWDTSIYSTYVFEDKIANFQVSLALKVV